MVCPKCGAPELGVTGMSGREVLSYRCLGCRASFKAEELVESDSCAAFSKSDEEKVHDYRSSHGLQCYLACKWCKRDEAVAAADRDERRTYAFEKLVTALARSKLLMGE